MSSQQRQGSVPPDVRPPEGAGARRTHRKDNRSTHHLGQSRYIRAQVKRQEEAIKAVEGDTGPALPVGVVAAARAVSWMVRHLIPQSQPGPPAQPSPLADAIIVQQAVKAQGLRYVKKQGSTEGQQGQAGKLTTHK